MDPLSLVRDFNVGKKAERIRVDGDDVNFDGQYVFPKKTFTAFRAARDYCTLEVVLYVLKTRGLAQPDYLRQAAASSLDVLSFIERRKLLEYLDGKGNLQLEAGPTIPASLTDLSGDDLEPAAKRAKQDGAAATLQGEQFHRQLRDRNTMLLAPQKEFKIVLDIANRAHMQLSNMFKQQQQQAAAAAAKAQAHKDRQTQAPAAKPAAAMPAATKPVGRFDRDTTADALKAMGGDAALGINQVINMYGTHAVPNQQPTSATNGAGQPVPGQPAQQPTRSKPAATQQQPFSQHRHGTQKPGPPTSSHHVKQLAGRAPAPMVTPSDPLQGAVPIIIVPSGMTAMINMYNARQFLEEGRFEPSNAAISAGLPKQSSMTIKRTVGKPAGKGVPYLVTDKPPDKKDTAMWSRVVAVIVQGAKWQFKDWPHKGAAQGEMLDTFSKVAGFYIHFSDDKVPEVVAGWNVRRLGLAREKRHMDTPVLLDLFGHLDAFLSARKSPLAY